MKRKYVLGALAVVLLLAGFFYFSGGGQVPTGQPPLKNLTAQNVSDVKNEFNRAKGDVRVLLLLSPT